jgi:hypothetical protein
MNLKGFCERLSHETKEAWKGFWDDGVVYGLRKAQEVVNNTDKLMKVLLPILSFIFFMGFIAYLSLLLKSKDAAAEVSNFVFILVQISISLGGFTFLAEAVDKKGFKEKVRMELITTTKYFLYAAFLLLFGFFTVFISSDMKQAGSILQFLDWSIGYTTIQNFSSGFGFLMGFFYFILAFNTLIKAILQIQEKTPIENNSEEKRPKT